MNPKEVRASKQEAPVRPGIVKLVERCHARLREVEMTIEGIGDESRDQEPLPHMNLHDSLNYTGERLNELADKLQNMNAFLASVMRQV